MKLLFFAHLKWYYDVLKDCILLHYCISVCSASVTLCVSVIRQSVGCKLLCGTKSFFVFAGFKTERDGVIEKEKEKEGGPIDIIYTIYNL